MLLRKSLKLSDVSLKMSGDSGQFEGYASVFDVQDDQGDVVAKGAYAETLKNDGLPKIFFNHEWKMPIAKLSDASEDSRGLYIKGEFTPGLSLAQDVRAAAVHGTIDGFSVGGFVRKGDYEWKGDKLRVINKWSKLMEVSFVAFPSNAEARVETAKGADIIELIENVEHIREIEGLLRDAAGLSKGAAVALIARVKALSSAGDPHDAEAKAMEEIAARLARLSF